MIGGNVVDTWFEVASTIEGFLTTCLFVYLIFHKEKCPHCAAREEISKTIRGENIVGGNDFGG